MSQLDDILKPLEPEYDTHRAGAILLPQIAKERIKALMLDLIGEDDQRKDQSMPDNLLVTDWQAKNQLRAEQRKKVQDL